MPRFGKTPAYFAILCALVLSAALPGLGAASCLAQDKPDAPVAKEPASPNEPAAPALAPFRSDASTEPAASASPAAPSGQGTAQGSTQPCPPASKSQSQSGSSSSSGSSNSGAAGTATTGAGCDPNAQQDENTKRILGFIPNFQSKDDIPENQKPLSAKEKYVLAYHQTVDFSAHIGNLFQAGLQQASNGQPHYGQGWGPYAQRFGAAEADQATSAFFIFGFLPHVLHDDPRYFRKRYGSVWSRIKYSASRTVITRTDAGNSTFNVPQVAGQLFQQAISTSYYPEVDRSASGVFQNWGVNLAYNSAYNVLKEFYPDFLRIAFHRHPKPDPNATPQSNP
jgi:hypothetical protein